MNNQRSLWWLACSLLASPTIQAGDAIKGQALSSACVECHGSLGLSNKDIYPNLAGQKQAYLIKALQQYQTGERSNLTMQAMVGPLSTQDIEDLAAYYAGNAVMPSYSYETNTLHIPVATTVADWYQVDMQHVSGNDFRVITLKPLK